MSARSLEASIAVCISEIQGLRTDIQELKEKLDPLDKRISSLERWRAFLAGAWFVGAAVTGYLLSK